MKTAIQVQTSVLPGSRVEVSVPQLAVGQRVDVIVLSPGTPSPEGWLDTDYQAECEADPPDGGTLEQVRAALAKVPGTMTADFIAERDER